MGNRNKGKYYSPIYVPKKSPAKRRRARMIRSAALVTLSVSMLAVILLLWQSNRSGENSLVAEAAAEHTLADVGSYPRIVDRSNPVSRDYVPENLVSLNTVPNGESIYLRADAAEGFLNMLNGMAKDGMAVIPVSGYISYEEQSAVRAAAVDKFIAEGCTSYEAEMKASESLPSPGENEAQLGTSVEVSTELTLAERFAATDQYRWICANAYKYGFVVRSADAPWRLRYVGKEIAERMQSAGCYLEAYVQEVRQENPSATEEAN